MKNFVINNSLVYIQNNNPNYNETELAEIKYGLTSLYLFITKMIVITICAFFLDMLRELLLFILIYSGIRAPSFGIHATKSWICLISSTLIFIGVPFLSLHLNLPLILKCLIGGICIVLLFKNCPADTKKKPIVNPKRRLAYKYLSTFVAIIYTALSIVINNQFFANLFLLSLVVQCVITAPLVYRIFKQPSNNYIAYLEKQKQKQLEMKS